MDPHVQNYEKYIYRAATSQETITPLTQYIRQTPIMHTNINPVGEKSGRIYCMMTEEAKLLISSLLEALHHFHINGDCLLHFNASNVVVTTSGRVKLKDINFQGKMDSLILYDYGNAHKILQRTMFTSSVIPEDIKHLLQLMNSPRAIDMEYVIRTHASLVPLRNRFQFFYDMYEQITSVLDNRPEKKRILNALPCPRDWHKRLQGNALLEESFHGGYTSYDPNGGPIVFLKFYRNTLMHRMERYLKPLKCNPHIRPLNYTRDDFEKILVVTYPMCLPIIQEELENENQLRTLNLHYRL